MKNNKHEFNRISYIFLLLFLQKMFEMNHHPIPLHILLAFVHLVVFHVQDNTIPNKHFQSVHHIDQYESKCIHANQIKSNLKFDCLRSTYHCRIILQRTKNSNVVLVLIKSVDFMF